MSGFFIISLLGALMISITGLITYELLRFIWWLLPTMHLRPRMRVLFVIAAIFALHILHIWLYAVAYFLIEHLTNFGELVGEATVTGMHYNAFIERLYFSATTYASLGLGDIRPTGDLRMLAAAEVLNGLVLIGWTISFTYLTMERFWLTHRGTA